MAARKKAPKKAPAKPATRKKAARKKTPTDRVTIPPDVQDEVLMKSARRCSLCFGFDGNLERVNGQIAHIDRNRANNAADNLAFLCQPHHDEYDTTRRQTKSLTQRELTNYRNRLYDAIEAGQHYSKEERAPIQVNPEVIAHDKSAFFFFEWNLGESALQRLLEDLERSGKATGHNLSLLRCFASLAVAESNRFILADLNRCLDALLERLDALDAFVAGNTFEVEGRNEVFRPDPALRADEKAYAELMREMRRLASEAREAYREYRRTIKRTLLV